MNRNSESHFTELPSVDIGRSKFPRQFNHKLTFSTSDLIPFYLDCTIMPGDTIKMNMGSLVRMLTPMTPVMDNLNLDTYFFFVPYRLIWNDFKKFMGENTDPWKVTEDIRIPKIEIGKIQSDRGKVNNNDLIHYLGIPQGLGTYNADTNKRLKLNHLPIRAYCQIWNDWFRDQNTQKELYFIKGNSTTDFWNKNAIDNDQTITDKYTDYVRRGGQLAKVNKYHDIFTSSLPEPQKGPTTLVPLVGEAPLLWGTAWATPSTKKDPQPEEVGKKVYSTNVWTSSDLSHTELGYVGQIEGVNQFLAQTTGSYTELVMDMENAVGATVNAIRQAFAIQKFYERQARGGSRYIEMVLSHFGVTNPDGRLQRSEYLGGKRIPISINQVVTTVATSDDPTGTTGAYSVTSDVSEDLFTHSFTEHGIVMGLCCARTVHTYQQGINKQWFMDKITDFYFPEFSNLGEVSVKQSEIYAQDGDNITENDEVFGYQECWYNYRYTTDRVSGMLTSQYAQSLDIWHYADYFSNKPSLNAEFMRETDKNVKRTLAYQEGDQFIADFFIDAIYTRPMPLYSVPGLLDHH